MMTKYYVRNGLVVRLNEEKTYIAGEIVELDPEQYERHAHQVQSVEAFAAMNQVKEEKKVANKK